MLAQAAAGPVVEVNRAVAHGRAHGPDAGLRILEAIEEGALADSPMVPSVRGDLLARSGDHAGAEAAFREAAALTRNDGERALLLERAEDSSRSMSKPAESDRRTGTTPTQEES